MFWRVGFFFFYFLLLLLEIVTPKQWFLIFESETSHIHIENYKMSVVTGKYLKISNFFFGR